MAVRIVPLRSAPLRFAPSRVALCRLTPLRSAAARLAPFTAKPKRRRGSFGDAPDLTPEEHRRRGDAATDLWREMCAGPARIDRAAADGTGAATAPTRCRPGAEALDEPFRAFPSWFMRITCDRCGKERMFSETHAAQRDMLIRDIIARMRHDGCGGRAGKVELLTGIEGASSRPVRRIVLIDG